MEVDGGHKQHPETKRNNRHREPAPEPQRSWIPILGDILIIASTSGILGQGLYTGTLHSAIRHDDAALLVPDPTPRAIEGAEDPRAQHDPADFLQEEEAAEDEQEHVSADIVTAAPATARGPARRCREDVLGIRPRRDAV